MKKIIMLLVLMPFLSSCLVGVVKQDRTHKFEATFTNGTTQEIKYKYEVSHFKTDGVRGLTKGGTLKPVESINLLDMKYGTASSGRQAPLFLLVGNNKVYEIVLQTDGSYKSEANFTTLTHEMLKEVDDEDLTYGGYYSFAANYGFSKTDKDASYFD